MSRSTIWNFFDKSLDNPNKANCKTCEKEYSCIGGTTSSIIGHLQLHSEEFKEYEQMKIEKSSSVVNITSETTVYDQNLPLSENVTSENKKLGSIMKIPTENMKLSQTNFSDHLKKMLQFMKRKTEFSDVTLICEDKEQFKANKVVLSACSPLFDHIISGIVHDNPVIFLSGVKAKDLDLILQFMYFGEVTVSQTRMDEFFQTAKILEVNEIGQDNVQIAYEYEPMDAISEKNEWNVDESVNPTLFQCDVNIKDEQDDLKKNQQPFLGVNKSNSEDLDESKTTITESLFKKETKGNKIYQCMKCEYQSTVSSNLYRHVQSIHEGRFYQCDKCEYQAKQNGNLIRHVKSMHEGKKYQCSACGKNFSLIENLKVHTKSMHDGVKYTCDICGIVTNRQSNLSQHKRLMHNKQNAGNLNKLKLDQ